MTEAGKGVHQYLSVGLRDEDRVRLYYVITELLPPPRISGFSESGGHELRKLDELVRKRLGRTSLARGRRRIDDGILDFIRSASIDDLYTLIELVPVAKIKSDDARSRRLFHRPNPTTSPDLRKITSAINQFLEGTHLDARFDDTGEFHRTGFVATEPVELARLPGKEELFRHITGLIQRPHPVSVLFIDLDNFKSVNDTLGHQAGDKCLAAVVETIGSIISLRGRLYRYGGDEFSVSLPNTVASEASATAERIRFSIQDTRPGGEIEVTASIGVASTADLPPPGINVDDLIEAADQAVYQAKNSGKNRVEVFKSR